MARDGAEALELLRTELPDVLLVDIDMPRMDGFDFLRHLRALHPKHKVPVIMISTRSGNDDRTQAADLGAAHFLTKPYADQDLQHALRRVGILD
jgi:chemosensory pili system protein ChpA (sensor histidine kinase/response regulator)